MCIIDLIKNLTLTEQQIKTIKAELLAWPVIAKRMSEWQTSMEVLPYLKVELETRGRMFYVSRLYGRWRKLLPRDDWDTINQYMKEHRYGPTGSED